VKEKAFARMVNRRSAISRAHIVEFQEATEEEALKFLEERLGEAKFKEKKVELVDFSEELYRREVQDFS